MFKTIRNAWKLPELRRKLLFVIFALLIFRVGAAIPVPLYQHRVSPRLYCGKFWDDFRPAQYIEWFGPVPGHVVCPVHPALY